MKSKIVTFIISIILILLIFVFAIFGVILFYEIKEIEMSAIPETITTIFSDVTDKIEQNPEESETVSTTVNPLDSIKEVNSNQSSNMQSYIEEYDNKYFYNQLEQPSKIIYNAFENNKDNMKKGTYKIDLGDSLSNVLSQTNGKEKLGEYYQSAIEAYTYDNPEIFYLSPNKMYLNIETTTTRKGETYNVYINNGSKSNYLIDEFSSENQVNLAIQQIEGIKNNILSNQTRNTYQDIKMVHDYLIENIVYDTTLSRSNIYNVYGALISKVSVCEGYARSFKYLMDEMQIPCVLVIGKATNSEGKTENHAWNYVKVDSNWYAIDVTWDDPIVIGGGMLSEENKYQYFLKGSNTFTIDHSPNGQFTTNGKIFEYPTLSDGDYN